MTHMAADVRSSGLDVLNWLLEVAGEEVVSCAGGYVRTLKCFLSVLGWNADSNPSNPSSKQHTTTAGGWSNTTVSKSSNDAKLLARTLTTLTRFISTALAPPDLAAFKAREAARAQKWFPLTHTWRHTIPTKSNAYGHLNLFGPPPDEDGAAYEDREERVEIYVRRFKMSIERGLDWARKEQGEVGRAAKGLERAVREGVEGYEG